MQDGKTALVIAASRSNVPMVQLLIKHHANIEAADKVPPGTKWLVGVWVCVVWSSSLGSVLHSGLGWGLGDVLIRTSSQTHILHNPIQS